MSARLSSRERVERAFRSEAMDRLPRHENFWRDTLRRWGQGELAGEVGLAAGEEDLGKVQAVVNRYLDPDISMLGPLYWPEPYPGRHEVVREDVEVATYVDTWGATVRYFKQKQTTPEHLGWECDSPERWERQVRRRIAEQAVSYPVEAVRRAEAEARREGRYTIIHGVEPFEILRKLLGDVVSLEAMIEEPEWIEDICQVTTQNSLRNFEAAWEGGVRADALWIWGDMAYNHATMCSPTKYRELVWPSHKALADWAHARGMRVIYHTDGNINGVLDLFAEAGIDGLNPLECKAGMDIRTVWEKQPQMTCIGNIDVMAMIPNEREVLEAEVRPKLEAARAQGGKFVYHSDHSVPPQVDWCTYRYLIELLDTYGNCEA